MFDYRTFWLPKDVEHPEGYQDAYSIDEFRGIAAIADGVSSGIFSGSWARILTESVIEETPDIFDANALSQWLGLRRKAWQQPIDVNSLAWHQKPKLQEGGASTLLWVELSPADSDDDQATGPIRLRCIAIGDCCLFHVRNGKVLRAFPIESSAAFDVNPEVLRSVDKGTDQQINFHTLDDYCRAGDLLILASDALAAWAITELESGRSPDWESFWQLSDDQWTQKVIGLRESNQIRYDDSTVVMLFLEKVTSTAKRPQSSDLMDTVQDKLSKWLPLGRRPS